MRGAGERRCEACGADRGDGGKKLLECAGCCASFFCSPQCQQSSWRTHKKLCRRRGRAVVKIQAGWRGWSARRRVLGKLLKVVGEGGEEACEVCGKTAPKGKELDVCDGCKLSLFCSRRCQRSGWKEHKIICKERQRAAAKIQSVWRRTQNAEQEEVIIRRSGVRPLTVLKAVFFINWKMDKDLVGPKYQALLLRPHLLAKQASQHGLGHIVYYCLIEAADLWTLRVVLCGIWALARWLYRTLLKKLGRGKKSERREIIADDPGLLGETVQVWVAFRLLVCLMIDSSRTRNERVGAAKSLLWASVRAVGIWFPWMLGLSAVNCLAVEVTGVLHPGDAIFFETYPRLAFREILLGVRGLCLAWTPTPDTLEAHEGRRKKCELLQSGRSRIVCRIVNFVSFGKLLLWQAAKVYVKTWVWGWILTQVWNYSLVWRTLWAKGLLFESYQGGVLEKWKTQNEASGGYFLRSIEGLDSFRLFCHPYDALSNLSWGVDWDASLTHDEVEFVHSNLDKMAQSAPMHLLQYPGPDDGRGFTTFAYPDGRLAADVRFEWSDISTYLSAKKELAELAEGDLLMTTPVFRMMDLVREYRDIVSKIEPPREELLDRGVLKSLAQILTFSSLFPLQYQAALTINDMQVIPDDFEIGDAIPFVQLLSSPIAEIREASTAILGSTGYLYSGAVAKP